MERKRLGDIVRGSTADFKATWDATEASTGFAPLPSGTYRCLITSGEIFTSKAKETPGYKITFEATSGPHAGRKIWHDVWLSEKALGIAKAELAKLGIVQPEQLEHPLPIGLIADVKIVQRTDDDGETRNRVKGFQVIRSEAPPADFAPPATVQRETLAAGLDSSAVAPLTNNTEQDGKAGAGRQPGEDDDGLLDADGFDWGRGEQSTIANHHANGAYPRGAR